MMINFGAGPAHLPEEVIQGMQTAMVNAEGSGLSIMELPHRGSAFKMILEELNGLVKSLLEVPDNYEVLWIQGGGRMQFAMLPMNFLQPQTTAGYLDSGFWAQDAMQYAAGYGDVIALGSSAEDNYGYIPELEIPHDRELSYLHLTSNNTIYGTEMQSFPDVSFPLIADMSSDIFSRKVDVTKFKLIYAVAQKNIGIAGVTMVIIDKAFAAKGHQHLPEILQYRAYMEHASIVNTPPVVAIYSCLLHLRYIHKTGLNTTQQHNEAKAQMLYNFIIENNSYLRLTAQKDFSKMNVCFEFINPVYNKQFITFAKQNDIVGIEGHRRVGGLRVSLYNAITLEDVSKLIEVLGRFIIMHR